ncbi:hypothetical protein [Cyclobacterium salsum]|uniref:hypothetical protein n=1 Tax=Cyclobacterium salsum TaxID=2666329 RepID=UPI0013918CB4|nr:hypothetical protein [Cyclobacterium salsum]
MHKLARKLDRLFCPSDAKKTKQMKTIILALMVCSAGLLLSCGKKATEETLVVPTEQIEEVSEAEIKEEMPLQADSTHSENLSPAVVQ